MSSPPRRRSNRLRGATPQRKNYGFQPQQLTSLAEREETPKRDNTKHVDTTLSSPAAPRTPATAGRIQPSKEEMFPALVHQSTTKRADEGLQNGFIDIHDEKNAGPLERTPTKIGPLPSASFDFTFPRPGVDEGLGPEANAMMQKLRDEVDRNKAKLIAEREERVQQGLPDPFVQGRKIAQPVRKAGRYSGAHNEQFSKMNSIAGHPSAYRAPLGNGQTPMTTSSRPDLKVKLNDVASTSRPTSRAGVQTKSAQISQPSAIKSLKRSKSKAQLDDDESNARARGQVVEESENKSVDQTSTPKRSRMDNFSAHIAGSFHRTDHPATPKQASTPSLIRSKSVLEHITTPTQSSLARSASKHATNIPTPSRSPSKPSIALATPHKSAKPSAMSAMTSMARSFLRRPDKSVSPLKSPTHLATTLVDTTITTNVTSHTEDGSGHARNALSSIQNEKHDYSNETKSPQKSGIPRSKSMKDIGASGIPRSKSMKNMTASPIKYPTLPDSPSKLVEYPSLQQKTLPDPPSEDMDIDMQHASDTISENVPGDFTFRAAQTISFSEAPTAFGGSPGMSSIRTVRASILPHTMPGGFPFEEKENPGYLYGKPHGLSHKKENRAEETFEEIPATAHGISNKRRHRASSDEGSDGGAERSPKKHKPSHTGTKNSNVGVPRLQQKLMAEKVASSSKIPSPDKKKRSGMTLSRLNMLARPKNRK